ncbi:hypothetical protein M413DRAFT_123683 [Hebeloma cylindrosporum]|uniref:CP-type G domain-containing protein n=1 Tax=Hebeloma cylindrosporum TaxID=76867 RepID=A0A0C3CF12_HEBCY|nr:hypothetical protein M413DRAFT_123683 [Hebeloma cylindrosporum h7]
MPRIRKETSNRRSTNDRAKRRKQVKESKRKTAKKAKKSVQWKSKTPKDPGIPNEFPYKDQILAEVAEQRRIAAEEKELKKAQKQRALAKARAIARGEPFEDSDAEDKDGDAEDGDDEEEGTEKGKKDLNVGSESIASLSAKVVGTQLKPRPRPVAEVEEEDEEDEDEVPVLINRDLPNLKTVLEKADVVLEVLDGRDPLGFRSQHIENLGNELGKKVVLVVNKIDTCPREAVASWSSYLRRQHPTFLFRSATSFLPETPVPQVKKGKAKAKIPTNDAVGGDSVLACLAQWAKEKTGDEPLVVAVVGVTNVGKSSLINSLLKRATLPVYTLASSSRGPTTTELPQEVTLEFEDQKILFVDTPGLSFISKGGDEEDNEEGEGRVDDTVLEEHRARDILLRSKGRIDSLKDPHPPVAHIVSRANNEDLMLMYSLPAFAKGDPTAFLSGVARANQLLKKKGELDLTGAARIVLRDWSSGKFSHYTIPPLSKATEPIVSAPPESTSTPVKPVNAALEKVYEKDVSILDDIPTRKEKRKAGGLVRLTAGVADERQVSVEEAWAGLQDNEEEEDEEDDDVEEDLDEMAVDEDEDEDEAAEEEEDEEEEEEPESDEEEEAPPLLSNKQKRKRALEKTPPERPAKKVAFAPPQVPRKNSRSGSKRSGDAPMDSSLKIVQTAAKKSEKSKNAVAGSKPIKSSLPVKGSSGGAPAKPSSAVKRKVANVSTKTKAKATAVDEKSGNGPEAYDFGKFF